MKGENMKNKKQGIKPVTTGFDKMSKVLSYTLVYASIALGATACVNEEKKEEKQTESNNTCKTGSATIALARAKSSDYSNYKVDLINKDGTVSTDAISIAGSGGIQSIKFFTDKNGKKRLLLMNSHATTGYLAIYDPADYTRTENTITVKKYGQEIAFANCRVFYAVQNDDKVKTLDLADVTSIGIATDIDVGKKPTQVRNYGGKIYVTNQDFTDKTQATVSIINPETLQVEKTINVGENPADLIEATGTIFSYDSKWYGGSNASISYDINQTANNQNAPKVSISGSDIPGYGGKFAKAGSTVYVLLKQGSNPFKRYTLTTSGVTNADNNGGLNYLWIGSHTGTIYKSYLESSKLKVAGGSLSSAIDLGTKQNADTFFVVE